MWGNVSLNPPSSCPPERDAALVDNPRRATTAEAEGRIIAFLAAASAERLKAARLQVRPRIEPIMVKGGG